MKNLFDKILSLTIVVYLIWICYYRLYAVQTDVMTKQLYFLFEGISYIMVLGRLYIEKYFLIKEGRYVILVGLIFKAFQVIYRLFKISPYTASYCKANNDVIWSAVGVILIIILFGIPLIKKHYNGRTIER